MRIATQHGPASRTRAAAWGALSEKAAAATGKRGYRELALRCYLRAVTIDPRRAAVWRDVRRLEAELKGGG
jgi:hypothetical protein